jgi:two-component system response regulator
LKTKIPAVEGDPMKLELSLAGSEAFCTGIDVACAADGVEAIEYHFLRARMNGDLLSDTARVIMVINMPRLDGISAVKALRGDRRTALTPIVMLSNSDDSGDIKAAYEIRANTFVRKPGLGASSCGLFGHMVAFWTGFNQSVA